MTADPFPAYDQDHDQDREQRHEPDAGADPAGHGVSAARREAVRRLEKKRAWSASFAAYVVVNAFLIGIWAVTGRGYFWPGWVLGGWGIGEVLSFWDAFVRRPITEEEIEAEMHRR